MRHIKPWSGVFGWAVFIFVLSCIPGLGIPYDCDLVLRKLAHMTEYFILTFLLYRTFGKMFNVNAYHLLFCSMGVACLYAMSDEFHQIFVRTRKGCVYDVMIDVIGILCFYLVARVYPRIGRLVRQEERS